MDDDQVKALHNRLRGFGKKLPDSAQDAYYESQAARINTIIGGDLKHVNRLQRVRNEWQEQALVKEMPAFNTYVEQEYGIVLGLEDRNLSLKYTVVNEAKYTVFLLKFSR